LEANRRLLALASANGMSVGEYARELVFTKLDQKESDHSSIEAVQSELGAFRKDFCTAVEALLLAASSKKELAPERAKHWVDTRLRHLKPATEGTA
jgi:hypothetical protein